MKRIMARRIDPRTGWQAELYKDEPRSLTGKEAVIVEEWQRGRSRYQDPHTGQWKSDGEWYVECEGERLRYSLQGRKQISASYYTLSELDASLYTEGQVLYDQRYHVADRYELRKHLVHLEKQAGHSTIQFKSAADLAAWLPYYRILQQPQQKEGASQ
jgi:hypothetical protein